MVSSRLLYGPALCAGLVVVLLSGCGADGGTDASDVASDGTDSGQGDAASDVAPIDADVAVDTGDDADAVADVVDADTGDADPDTGDADPDTGDADPDTSDLGPDVPAATCGDGTLDDGEACDDGNDVDDDRCTNGCEFNEEAWCRVCADEVPCDEVGSTCVETGHGAICAVSCDVADADACAPGFACEELDDGGFACLPSAGVCFSCGDGALDEGDACDDANALDGDGCSRFCDIEEGYACSGEPSACTTVCGDGILLGGEACDDNNSESDDGCSDVCSVEVGWDCTSDGGAGSACVAVCGDALIVGAESCDDGAATSGDGCSDACQTEDGWTCTGEPSTCTTTCGDGVIAGTEACDDNNTGNGDGCSDSCVVESGWACEGATSVCETVCGDGVLTIDEQCDDTNTADGDGCSSACEVEQGWDCDSTGTRCAPVCGDGEIVGGEQCDDTNTADGDGCSAECVIEGGWYCDDAPSVCETRCGDGVAAGAEPCDDGNDDNTDACTNACTVAACGDGFVQEGEACDDGNEDNTDACTNVCNVAVCGDGFIQAGEECDDANDSNTDGCTNVCALPRCGDGFHQPRFGEECDDGNGSNNDACTNACFNAVCGDAFVQTGVEACDDGNDSNADACTNSCADAVCGDSFVQEGVEQCDDGNSSNNDTCTNACRNAVCGDGFPQPGEACDDGNGVNTDACTNACQNAVCGDSIVQTGVEQCDDGNSLNTDACTNSCRSAVCGDGFVRAGVEDCDDGNVTDLDACRSTCSAYRSCAHALDLGATVSRAYSIRPSAAAPAQQAYCDMTTDGGGWTLVGSTRGTTLDDSGIAWYPALTTLAPTTSHSGMWNGMRPLDDRFDVRVACRATNDAAADAPFTVDLSFYDVPWYTEWTTGTDSQSCFSESNGAQADSRVPARRDNVGNRFRRAEDPYNQVGYLEGEDSCDALDDFTLDFDDRGMDGDQNDGTDWGEDDGQRKCGTSGLAGGQWFVMVRERGRVAVVGLGAPVETALRNEGFLVDLLPYDASLPAQLTVENYDTIVLGRYADSWSRMTSDLREALHVYARSGGNIVTEWDGASILMSGYAAGYRYSSGAATPLGLYAGTIGGGNSRGNNTAVTQTVPTDPIFRGVPNPFAAGSATEFFFFLEGATQMQTLATFPGGVGAFPAASYGAVYRGRHCGGNTLVTTFDWSDGPTNAGLGPFVANLVREASQPPPAYLAESCQDARRATVTLCGTSQRPLSDFGITLPVVNVGTAGVCTATETTQAVFITRNGVSNLDSTGLRNYVLGGGIIITEFSASDEVYNAVFQPGTAVVQGARIGVCGDNIMPTVQFRSDDSFWQDNRFVSTPTATAGCGQDLAAYPGIIPLGGTAADTVTLAYRDLGNGRVWFVEADWQDTQATMTEDTRGLMRHMYRHRGRGALDRGATFTGVRTAQNIHDYIDAGFQPCARSLYNSTLSLSEIQDACAGDVLMMACRQVGSSTLEVSAIGRRTEVFEEVADTTSAVNLHNGTNWYFGLSRSWGFAPASEAVNRNSCDTLSTSGNQRLCWHTNAGNMTGGYRCGTNLNLNASTTYERIVLHRFGDLPPL